MRVGSSKVRFRCWSVQDVYLLSDAVAEHVAELQLRAEEDEVSVAGRRVGVVTDAKADGQRVRCPTEDVSKVSK